MGPRGVVVLKILREDAHQVCLVDHDDMVEAFSPNRADQPLDVRILPRGAGRDRHLFDSKLDHAPSKRVAVDAVVVADEEFWRGVEREGFGNLLSGPLRGGIRRHIEMDNSPAVGRQDEETIQQAKRGGRNHEEVHGRDLWQMVLPKRSPRR